MNCELVTTNCLTGKAEYMSEEEDRDRLMKICRASSSMPLLTPIVNIEDVPYLDGGLADSVPIRRAKEIGNEKIVVVLTKMPVTGKKYFLLQCRSFTERLTVLIQMWCGRFYGEVLCIIRR